MRNNNVFVLTHIPLNINHMAILTSMGLTLQSPMASEIIQMFNEAVGIAKPKIALIECRTDAVDPNFVIIDGQRYFHPLLIKSLQDIHKVYPFIASCGKEIEVWFRAQKDQMKKYCAQTIMLLARDFALYEGLQLLKRLFHYKMIDTVAPNWNRDNAMKDRKQVYQMLQEEAVTMDIRCRENGMTIPSQTNIGVFVPDASAPNCEECDKEDCQKREAPYANVFKEHTHPYIKSKKK